MLGLTAYTTILLGLLVQTVRRPAAVLAAVLCLFGLKQWGQATTPFLFEHRTLTNFIVGGLVLLAFGVSVLRGRRPLSNYPSVGWVTLILIAYSLISSLWAPRPDISVDLVMANIPYFATLVLITPLVFSRKAVYQEGLIAFVVAGFILSVLVLFFVDWGLRGLSLGNDVTHQTNPLALAQMAGGVAVVVLLLNLRAGVFWSVLKWVIAGVCMVVVVRTSSRGQLLAMLAACILCWPMSRRVRNPLSFLGWALSILIMLTIVSFALDFYFKGDPRWDTGSALGDASGRLGLAFILLDHWMAGSPFTIIFGLGNSASFDPGIIGFYPHVMPLEVLGEEGVVGFALLIYIVVISVVTTLKTYHDVRANPEARGVLATLAALCLMTLLLSCKQGNLLQSTEFFMEVILLGRFCAIVRFEKALERRQARVSFSRMLALEGGRDGYREGAQRRQSSPLFPVR